MAKRKEDAPPAGAPAWMATFSDLMNLLLCFFVMLFAMSSIEEAKLQDFVAAMNNTFSVFDGGAAAIGDGFLISNGVSQLNELDQYINSTGKTADSETEGEDGVQTCALPIYEVEVSFTAQYIQLTMNGALCFDNASAQLRDEAKLVLDKVGVLLERYGTGIIEIEGHTDNVPISNALYASNEELSSARAMTVFYYLRDTTSLNTTNLKHSGMGERCPIADNSTPEGRSRNRRVEIRIYSPSLN